MSIESERSSRCTPAECYVYSIGDMKIMKGNVTPEIAAAHRSLEELCEKFETSVDEFCRASAQSFHPHEFYECECVPLAAACADALSALQPASSYEITAYENAVAEAGNTLRQQKREIEKGNQRVKAYESEVTRAENALTARKREIEGNANQKAITYEAEVAEVDNALHQQKCELEDNAAQRITDIELEVGKFANPAKYVGISLSLTEATQKNYSKTSYHEALGSARRFCKPPISWRFLKKKRIAATLQTLKFAAVEECDAIRKKMQNEIRTASTARDKKVEELLARKERADKEEAERGTQVLASQNKKIKDARSKRDRKAQQNKEAAAKTLAVYDKKIKDARLKRDRAIAYIYQEYQTFDKRLCQCLDKFQSLVDTWTTKNIHVTSLHDNDEVQYLSESDERTGSCLTRIGTVSIWDYSEQRYPTGQDNARAAKSVTTLQPTRDTNDVEAAKYYLKAITSTNRQGNSDSLKNLNRMAEQGNPEAQFNLGSIYENGIGAPQDTGEAVKWYRKAVESRHLEALKNLQEMAEQGNSEAQFNLGSIYENGIGAPQDTGEAVKWYRKAVESRHTDALRNLNRMAQQGHGDAQLTLVNMYENGIGVKKNYAEMIRWYRKLAEQGHADAQYKLGEVYEHGRGVQKDYTEAINWYKKASKHGHAQAKASLTDLELLKAASEGDADAQYELGKMYLKSKDRYDNDKALDYYKKAAEQGHVDALKAFVKLIGNDYFFDTDEEVGLYQKAIKNGNADAFNHLVELAKRSIYVVYIIGMMYEEGQGVSQSDHKAVEWYEKAADRGYADAQYKLGDMHYDNYKIHDDGVRGYSLSLAIANETSYDWYKKAAKQGHADAQYKLGKMFELDKGPYGGKPGRSSAIEWYKKAAEQGHEDAQKALHRLDRR